MSKIEESSPVIGIRTIEDVVYPSPNVAIARPRAYFSAPTYTFLRLSSDQIVGALARNGRDVEDKQKVAWLEQIRLLQWELAADPRGHVYFELEIPRVGRRADVVVIKDAVVFVLEFKVNAVLYSPADIRQAEGYAIDLKNFHEQSHSRRIVPILVATSAPAADWFLTWGQDLVAAPLLSNGDGLGEMMCEIETSVDELSIDADAWSRSSYKPTPTIVEAAQYLYANHDVAAITRTGAGAENITVTSAALTQVVTDSRRLRRKSICFVTGVPGAGKTLVGLNLASQVQGSSTDQEGTDLAVFLSGNGPLVDVLREALARDSRARDKTVRAGDARRKADRFIQNIHHFRDDALSDFSAPVERVAVFDEAQRAWDRPQTSKFMSGKRGQIGFDRSEAEFLLGVMDRHEDWCVVVALVGGGQEINVGEAGIAGWYEALESSFPEWDIYYSDKLNQIEYVSGSEDFAQLSSSKRSSLSVSGLHLSTSLRSFRADHLSHMVHHVIANDSRSAREELETFAKVYPIRITRDIVEARKWIRSQQRGTESTGMLASSGGVRLRPHGLQVKNDFDAPVWFLNAPEDVRSSNFMEVVATEFDTQGLELDWALVAWDADFRHNGTTFEHWNFRGAQWQRRRSEVDRRFLENAYRVLLTRARQGMVLFIPEGDEMDPTRDRAFYDNTYAYLLECGMAPLPSP